MRATSCRSLLWPLCLSLLLHALLRASWPAPVTAPSGTARRSIAARLLVPPPAPADAVSAPDTAALASVPSVVEGERDRRRPAVRRGRSMSPGKAAARALPGPAAQERLPEGMDDGMATDADALRQYRLTLAVAARRFKPAPMRILAGDWQGTTIVVLELRSLAPPRAIVAESSGNPRLDALAQEMLLRAAATTALPAPLARRDLRLVIPVQFSRDDAP